MAATLKSIDYNVAMTFILNNNNNNNNIVMLFAIMVGQYDGVLFSGSLPTYCVHMIFTLHVSFVANKILSRSCADALI